MRISEEIEISVIRLNLAEALNRIKHDEVYTLEKSEEKALRALACAEYHLTSEINNRKFCFGNPVVNTLQDWGHHAYKRLPQMVLEVDPKVSLAKRKVIAGSLSHVMDELLEGGRGYLEIYEGLSLAIWDVERINHSNDGARYLEVVDRLRNAFPKTLRIADST